MKNGIYLGAYMAKHECSNLIYQDINNLRDLGGDMMDLDLSKYDYIICTPPCNYYSRANWRRDVSDYSLRTKHLLPGMIYKLALLGKPFIVENVRNSKRFSEMGLFKVPGVKVIFIGRHTYWTNVDFKYDDIIQKPIIDYDEFGNKKYMSSQNLPGYLRQGTNEVHEVVQRFINQVIL